MLKLNKDDFLFLNQTFNWMRITGFLKMKKIKRRSENIYIKLNENDNKNIILRHKITGQIFNANQYNIYMNNYNGNKRINSGEHIICSITEKYDEHYIDAIDDAEF